MGTGTRCVYDLNMYNTLLRVLDLYMCICADLWLCICPDENGTGVQR